MAPKPGRGAEQFVVRLPDGMRESIREAAEASGRSMNAEIVARLEASFAPRLADDPDTRAYLEGLIRSVAEDLKARG